LMNYVNECVMSFIHYPDFKVEE